MLYFGSLSRRKSTKLSARLPGVVLNGADIVEDLFQALVQEPLIRVLLDLDQVRILMTSSMWEKLMRSVLPSFTGLTFIIKSTTPYGFILYGMSYTRVKFEQTHIIRPASKGTFRRFSQTFRFDPSSRRLRIPLFGALVHYVILMQYTP